MLQKCVGNDHRARSTVTPPVCCPWDINFLIEFVYLTKFVTNTLGTKTLTNKNLKKEICQMASNRELLGCHVLYTKWLYTTSEVRCKPTQDTNCRFCEKLAFSLC